MIFEWQWQGEFVNEGYQQRNEKLNIETCTTTVESLFSNGTVERYNLEKMLDGKNYEPEIAQTLTVNAKNGLQNHFGNLPNDLVFGFNIKYTHSFDWSITCIGSCNNQVHC